MAILSGICAIAMLGGSIYALIKIDEQNQKLSQSNQRIQLYISAIVLIIPICIFSYMAFTFWKQGIVSSRN